MQNLVDWARAYGRGAYTHLQNASGVAYRTVVKAARDGRPVRRQTAELLSRATRREVSAAAIRRGVNAEPTS